jgi:hypothetical protein
MERGLIFHFFWDLSDVTDEEKEVDSLLQKIIPHK